MTAADVDPAATAILADAWGDRRSWFAFALENAACHPLVAELDGDVVGTGVATINGPVAWVGTIWVAPAHRRLGLGRALTDAVIDLATDAGARTLLLVATDRGRPLYERLGFEVQTWYRTFEATGGPSPTVDEGDTDVGRLRAFRPADLDALAALDRVATGEDRRVALADLATPDGTRILEGDAGTVRGFVARAPWGGGATVAPRIDDAATILRARRTAASPDRRVRCGIVLENEAGAAMLEGEGWHEAWRAPRLIRGEPLAWRPDQLWGQFNFAMG
jgi:ribosomal protein S18 acetylase RimI-like enzyme